MSEYIPFNEEIANSFENRISGNLLFQSTDHFIAIYNNNLINKSNDEIDSLAKEIVDVYKNVELINRKFIVKSKEEVVSNEFEILFPHISFIVTLKRIATDILKDNYPEDTMIVFTESEPTLVQILNYETNDVKIYEGSEKLRNVNKSLASNPFITGNIELHSYGEDGIKFKAVDIVKLDTSFVSDIGDLLQAYIE